MQVPSATEGGKKSKTMEDPVGECLIDRKQLGPNWTVECSVPPGVIANPQPRDICDGEVVDIDVITEDGSDLEIDVTFEGEVKSSMGNWYPPKDYGTRHLNNWFRRNNDINEELKMRLKLIGGSPNYKIKKITCL